jgi:hypothetical protein
MTMTASLKRITLLLFSLLLAPASALAAPPVCGDVLYQSITLQQDLVCPQSGPAPVAALTIGADQVRIELNGYSIIGPGIGVYSVAVRSVGFDEVQVVGPGTITNFPKPIEIVYGTRHYVSGVSASQPYGDPFVLRNVTDSLVEDSYFTAIELMSFGSGATTGNKIVRNAIGTIRGGGGGSIMLFGCGTSANVIGENRVVGQSLQAPSIDLSHGPRGNLVYANDVYGWLLLWNASENTVIDNAIRVNRTKPYAIGIFSYPPNPQTPCSYSPSSDRNLIDGNKIDSGINGVWLGDNGRKSPNVVENQLSGNEFMNQSNAGLYFAPSAARNDGRGNNYSGVAIPVIDLGFGNLWP